MVSTANPTNYMNSQSLCSSSNSSTILMINPILYVTLEVNRERTVSSHVHFCHCNPKLHWLLSVYIRPTHLTTPKEDKNPPTAFKNPPSYTKIGPPYLYYSCIYLSLMFLSQPHANWENQTPPPSRSLNPSSFFSLQGNLNVGCGLRFSLCICVHVKATFEWSC